MNAGSLNGVLGVDTFQVPVPGGDCAIILLIDKPPMEQRQLTHTDNTYHNSCPAQNSEGKHGTILRAILVDGGHDATGAGYYGKEAANQIRKTIQDIEYLYRIVNYPDQGGLKFDAWIVTHWDRDHYCGALLLFWLTRDENNRCPYIRYDEHGNGKTTLYCPTWTKVEIPNSSKEAKGHHEFLGNDSDGKWFIRLPQTNDPRMPLAYLTAQYEGMNHTEPFGRVVSGCPNLLGLDFFTGKLFSDNTNLPKFASADPTYRIRSVCDMFRGKYGGSKPDYDLDLPFGYRLDLTNGVKAKWPVLLCVGALGAVMGCNTKQITHATGDNYVSISMVLVWLPDSPQEDPHVSLFAGGDAHMDTEDLVVTFLEGLHVEVLKAGHHGARTSTSAQMLRKMAPNKFIISAGQEFGHPSWQILAFLSAYYHSQNHPQGDRDTVPFYYKNLYSSFCQTTRFPYYFYMLRDSRKVPSSTDLNLKSYLDARESYNAFFDYLGGGFLNPQQRNWHIVSYWFNSVQQANFEDVYSRLAKLDPRYLNHDFSHNSVSLILDKLFYPYHLMVQQNNVNKYKHKADLCRVLIGILRHQFSQISPYPSDYDTAGSIRQELREIVIHSRHNAVLDGRITRIEDDTATVKFQFKIPVALVKKSQKRNIHLDAIQQDTTPIIKPPWFPKKMQTMKKRRYFKGSKNKHVPSAREQGQETVLADDDDLDEEEKRVKEALEEANLLYYWQQMGIRSTFDFTDVDEMVCEGDDIPGSTVNATDSLAELKLVDFGEFSLGFDEQAANPIIEVLQYNPAAERADKWYPKLPTPDEWAGNHNELSRTHDEHANHDPNRGEPLETHVLRPLMRQSVVAGSSSINILGIAYNPDDQKLLQVSEKGVFSSFPPDSADSTLYMIWPGRGFRFASPIPSNTQGPFEVILSNDDETFGLLGDFLGRRSEDELVASMLKKLELTCTLLQDKLLNAVPGSQVDQITATLAVGQNMLVFSSKLDNLNLQFGLQGNSLTGLQLRSEEVLLALAPVDLKLTVADVFALADVNPAPWIKKVLAIIDVKLDSDGPGDKETPWRNGLWLSPENRFSAVLRLQFELLGIPVLSSLSPAMRNLDTRGRFVIIAKRSASLSPLGDSIDTQSEVILQTSITIPTIEGTNKPESDVSAYIYIREDNIQLCLVRHSAAGSMKNLFSWITKSFDMGEQFSQKVAEFQKSLEQTSKSGSRDMEKSDSDFDLSWRSFSVTFNSSAILELHACFEAEMGIGVPKDKTAGFSLDFMWQPRRWQVSGSFMPGGIPYIRGDDENLDPSWELCDWVPPLNRDIEPTMSIFHLDPLGLLNESTVPSYIPTEITLATLTLSSEGVAFSALLKSRNSIGPPPSPGAEVPMIPMTKASLFISTTYNPKATGGSSLSLLISGTIYLPEVDQGTGAEVSNSFAPPSLNATIQYDGTWQFSATAKNICIGSLVSLFGGEVEQEDVKDMLGHLILDTLGLKYTYQKSTASSLDLTAVVLFKSYSFTLTYGRKSADKDSGWDLTMELTKKISSSEVKLAAILQWILGDSIKDSLPDFIADATVNLENAKFVMSLTNKKDKDGSSFTLSTSFNLGALVIQFARMQVRPASLKKGEAKPPSKTILRVAINSLPRPPPLPLVGQIDQPFSVDFRWLNANLSSDDVGTLNTSAAFKKQNLPLDGDAKRDDAYGKGISFMLLSSGKAIISSKPKQVKKKSDKSSSQITAPEKADATEPTTMKPFEKRVNGVSISNVGLDYDADEQQVKIKFSARATLGPLDGELINFVMSVKLPRSEEGKGIQLSDWNKLKIDLDIDGVALGMTGPNLAVAGFLQHVNETRGDMVIKGFEGGIGVTLKPYAFTAFGSYKDVTENGETFVSLMVYAMLQGPILKTPYVEIRGISGGFGLGSQLTLPEVTQIQNFPLLMSATPNPIDTFSKLRGSGSGPRYITEVNGATWFAVGVLATACETVDVSAVLTLALGPNVNEIGLLGTAAVRFPRDKPPDKALALIELDFSGKIDLTHGFFRFDGQISQRSFLLNSDCRPTGGFVVAAWFGPSPQAGDWCVSIGGWHPAYVPPAHYPQAPPRLGVAWRFSSQLAITGQAYAAVTPDALMGGAALSALFSTGSVGAHFDFRADFILYMHPLHYDAQVYVSAGLWYELHVGPIRKKMSINLGAELHISGPPFAGVVSFDACVVTINVKFGDQQQGRPAALSLQEFVDVCLKKAKTGKADEPQADHVLSLESGGLSPSKAPNEAQKPDTPWEVRGPALVFSVASRVPTGAIDFRGAAVSPNWSSAGRILARPMQLGANSQGLTAPLTVRVTRKGSDDAVRDFRFENILEKVPASLWGAYDADAHSMLHGAGRESTVPHVIGLRIMPPKSEWSKKNPKTAPLADLAPPVAKEVWFKDVPVRDKGLDARARAQVGGHEDEEEDFSRAREALLGMKRDDPSTPEEKTAALVARNGHREVLLDQWVALRASSRASSRRVAKSGGSGQPNPPPIVGKVKSQVPLRYTLGLERFSHVAPRVTVE